MAGAALVVIGVDCGGTNTDAVLIQQDISPPKVLCSSKVPTTVDVTSGVKQAITRAIHIYGNSFENSSLEVAQVNIGTTHFVNAIVQRRGLTKVSVIRLCGPASRCVPPFSDFHEQLRLCIEGDVFLVNGGVEFDGREISSVDDQEILSCVASSVSKGIRNFVVCGIFSPVKRDQENRTRDLILQKYNDISVTVSHEIGQMGLLERENASILNECLKPLGERTIVGFQKALSELELTCPLFLTQNDGTIVSENIALRQPVCTFACGPVNSMRGAAFLSGLQDALVVDIGGTTSDIGLLIKGFPREASSEVKLGGIRTNFHMPDILSIGLGGGSYVTVGEDKKVKIGPTSAGYNLTKEALVFGTNGDTKDRKLTATDIAVSSGLCKIGNVENTKHLDKALIEEVMKKIHTMIESAIDQIKISPEDLSLILVGGGAVLVDTKRCLTGVTKIFTPPHSNVANAVGAALGQVSGTVDYVESINDNLEEIEMKKMIAEKVSELGDDTSDEKKENMMKRIRKEFFEAARKSIIEKACARAVSIAKSSGAVENSVIIVEKNDTPLSYLPGNATRLQVKAVGDLSPNRKSSCVITPSKYVIKPTSEILYQKEKQTATAAGVGVLGEDERIPGHNSPPNIDHTTGEWILSEWDIECISIGAGILGCGGGGSPYLGKLLAKMLIKEGKKIRIVSPERLLSTADEENDIIIPVGIMGAPLIIAEKLVSKETLFALQCMQDLYRNGGYENGHLRNQEGVEIEEKNGVSFIKFYDKSISTHRFSIDALGHKKIIALTSAEIGGMNSIEPLRVSADLNLPVIDSDGMGRAFPELQMYMPLIYGANPYPSTLADEKGRRDVVLKADTAKQLENHFREVVVEMGCSGGVIISSLNKREMVDKMVPHSLSCAWRLGKAVLMSRYQCESPIEAVMREGHGQLLITGKIYDVKRETTGGFNKGFVMIEGTLDYRDRTAVVDFQNENLVAKIGCREEGIPSQVRASVPDLIVIVDIDTGEPIPTENTRYGQRVALLVLPSHRLLRTPEALNFVGPRAFGYNIDFIPCGPSFETEPVAPRK